MSEKTGKIHEVVGDQILVNKAFREGIQEYWSQFGINVVLPDESMMQTQVPEPLTKKVKPWDEGTFRYLSDDEIINVGDQWAPNSAPNRWRNVADSVGTSTSRFKVSRFRRLTIETEEEVLPPPGQDTGANLIDVDCFVWNDGDTRTRNRAIIDGFDPIRMTYNICGTNYRHARPSHMGEPALRPQHPHKDAGAALVRCICWFWNNDSVNHDPKYDGVKGMVASFDGTNYTMKGGNRYKHAQPVGDSIVTVPPITLPPTYSEVYGQTGEAVVGRECWVWNTDRAARPVGIEAARREIVTEYKHESQFCYKTQTNWHQFARPVEFGHPRDAGNDVGPVHVLYGGGKIGFATTINASAEAVIVGVEGLQPVESIVKQLTGADLVGKRVWCFDGSRAETRSYIVEKHAIIDGFDRYTVRSMDKVDGKEIHFPGASLDLLNQSPRQNSGDELIGVECYVWNERFSAERIAVIEDYDATGYLATAGSRAQRFPNARPVGLGVI